MSENQAVRISLDADALARVKSSGAWPRPLLALSGVVAALKPLLSDFNVSWGANYPSTLASLDLNLYGGSCLLNGVEDADGFAAAVNAAGIRGVSAVVEENSSVFIDAVERQFV
jgi:hypothetical protein